MKTAQEYREMAAQDRSDKAESFERCDTDGFMSQWASGMMARLNDALAEIADNGGTAQFPCLMEGDRRVEAILQNVYCKYTYSYKFQWLLGQGEARKYGRKTIPFSGRSGKSRIQKKHGLSEAQETAPADAKIDAPHGGGATSCYVLVYRTDIPEGWGEPCRY